MNKAIEIKVVKKQTKEECEIIVETRKVKQTQIKKYHFCLKINWNKIYYMKFYMQLM